MSTLEEEDGTKMFMKEIRQNPTPMPASSKMYMMTTRIQRVDQVMC